MGLFDFLKPQKKGFIRVTVKGSVSINGENGNKIIFDEIIDPKTSKHYKEEGALTKYEVKHNKFKSLNSALERKKKYQDIIKRERRNGFAIKGGSNLTKLSISDKKCIKDFDTLLKPIISDVSTKPFDYTINNIINSYRMFNKESLSQISVGYVQWYLDYATILFDIETQFKKK